MKTHVTLLFLAAALLVGCDSSNKPPVAGNDAAATVAAPPPTPKPDPVQPMEKVTPVGKAWLVDDIENKGVIDNARTFIRFDAADKVSGSGGINKFSGPCALEGKNLTIGALRSTKMAGVPALMHQEAAFHQALSKVKTWEFDKNGTLYLKDAEGTLLLRLTVLDEA